ncbi:MAG TPA: efflux transporter outer membrane subunit [Burkholderiales bacterium]|nr:efflux transporter outer membrane subunit [Burkholderiales bacterium]
MTRMSLSACRRCAVVGLSLALAACALKAPPERSELAKQALGDAQPPAQWRGGAATQGAVADGWLKTLNDPRLDALVDETLARNADLRAAATRVEQAEASLKVAGSTLYPAVNLLARDGGKMGGDGSGLTGVVLSAGWELDLWGRIRYGQRAASGDLGATQADFAYARQSLAALVARSWFVAAESALQAKVAREMLAAAERLAELTRARLKVGNANEQDVALADANVQTYRDSLRQLELAREQALRALELLAGRYPSATLAAGETLPALPAAAPAGVPSELLERRPDVIAAERRVAAAFDRVEEAKAARLPRISLTAGIASIFSSLFVLQDRDNPSGSFGANLAAPLFTGFALQGQVEVRTAEQKRAVAEYASTGLKAFNEVESALASEAALGDRYAALSRLVEENERALKFSEIQYRVGKIDQTAVTNAQLRLYASRAQLVHLQAERLAQRVALHLALGGSFAS